MLLLYDRDASWPQEAAPPKPSLWMHQLMGDMPAEAIALDPDILGRRIAELVARHQHER